MFVRLLTHVKLQLATYRAYRRTVAEIESMSHHELIDLRVYQDDLRSAAWRRLDGR